MGSKGFGFIAGPDARVLILGTLPGQESLARGEYYAYQRNSFWWIMGNLLGFPPLTEYCERCRILVDRKIALWDVCESAERDGSSDSKILDKTVKPNDFNSFFQDHPRIELVCFNGQRAGKLFRRIVLPLPTDVASLVFKSTSPANARSSKEEKLEHWRIGLLRVLN